MRVPSLPVALLSVPAVLAASYGIYRLMERHPSSLGIGKESVPTVTHVAESQHHEPEGRKHSRSEAAERLSGSKSGSKNAQKRKDDADPYESLAPAKEPGGARERLAEIRRAVTSHGSMQKDGICSSFELFGAGPQTETPTSHDWQKAMSLFHESKEGLLAWTLENRWRIPDRAWVLMESRVREVRLQRPPTSEEPDLAYRGVGVLTEDPEGKPLIRLGAGFIRLVSQSPTRAKFEITRLIAQTWAPCELEKAKVEQPWPLLLSCLGLAADPECSPGTYSEAGWAVSSVIAAKISPPGCELPALIEPDQLACANKLPLPLTVSLDRETREARR